jgi:flavin-dependent dehydrogenase
VNDLVVVGGGPSGCAAAITAAAFGLKIALIERDPFPRNAPGESLHPGVQPILRQLGVEEAVLVAGFPRHQGYWVNWNNHHSFQSFGSDAEGPWLGFQVQRSIFDSILLNRVKALGVEVFQPCDSIVPVVVDGRITGLETEYGRIESKAFIDATGRWRAFSRWLNLSWQQYGPSRIVWYGYANGCNSNLHSFPQLIGNVDGWTWIANIGKDRYAWTRNNLDNRKPETNWLPKEIEDLKSDGAIRGADATWKIVEKPASEGLFLVGEAAASLDPLASHGILKALMSGINAGNLIGRIHHREIQSDDAHRVYCKWLNSWFIHDLKKLDEYYSELVSR